MNLPTAGKKLVVETINIDELPEEVASAIKNYTAASSGSGGVEETGEKADFAYPTLLYDTEGNCLRIADQLEWPEGGSLLKCSNCDYITDKRANWYKHKRIHEGSRSYCCSVCDYKATTSSNLKRHMMSHTGVRTFVCSVTGCNARFFQKIHLQRHIKYRHMVKQVRCQLCDYTCALENPDLKIHMLRKHVPKKPPPKPEKTEFVYQCGECKFQTLVKKDLQQHMKFHSRGPELKLFCEQCSFVTDCQSRLNRHLLTHTKEKPFKCGVCEYRASQKEHVIRHMRTKHKLDVHKSKQVVTQLLREEELESFSAGEMVGSQGTSGEKLVEKELDTGTSHIVAKEDNQVENDKNVILTAQDVNGLQDEFLIVGDKVEVAGEGQESVDDVGGEHHTVEERKESWEYIQKATESDVNPRGEVTQTECLPSQHVSEEVVSNSPMVAIASDSDAGSELFINQQSDIEVVQSSDVRPTVRKETIYNKKKYAKADFSTLPKIFNCQYCTMRFAKLINLYKHIHVQHASVHPMPPEGTYACVVCDFKTPQKKALLVHMRRHNPEGDQDDRPNMIYSCVLCQYSTPKRRNLYWHLKKKHKISLLVNKDGTAKCVVEEDGPVVVVTAPTDDGAVDSDGQQVALSIQEKEGSAVHKVVNVSELAHSLIQPKVTSGGDSRDTAQPAIEVVVNDIKTEEDEDAAVAIEGLQALAEQMIQTPTEVVVSPADETEINTDEKNIQLSSEQIMQLSSGDYIEIDGEMYKVELTPEEGSEIMMKANTVQDC